MVEKLLQILKENHHSKVVLTLGSSHAGIVEKLQAKSANFASLEVEAISSVNDQQMNSIRDVAENNIRSNQEISNDLAARMVLAELLENSPLRDQLKQVYENPLQIQDWVRQAVEQFSAEEIGVFYNQLISDFQVKLDNNQFHVIGSDPYEVLGMVSETELRKLLASKNIELPTGRDNLEINQFV